MCSSSKPRGAEGTAGPTEQIGTDAHAVEERTVKALLADDDATSLLVATTALEILGCAVVPVMNGRDAFKLFRQERFDVVFLDHRMAGLPGPTVARLMRWHEIAEGLACTPLVALTACAMPEEVEAFVTSGIDDVLLKPLMLDKLETLIESLSAGRSGQHRASAFRGPR